MRIFKFLRYIQFEERIIEAFIIAIMFIYIECNYIE